MSKPSPTLRRHKRALDRALNWYSEGVRAKKCEKLVSLRFRAVLAVIDGGPSYV